MIRRWQRAGRRPISADTQRRAEWGARRAHRLWEELYAPFGLVVDGRTVLELGCSWGYVLRFLLDTFSPRQVIGVDPDGGWEDVSHGWDWEALGDRVALHLSDLTTTRPVPAGSIDAILCAGYLQRLDPDDVEPVLRSAYELLKPGGEMIVRTPCFTAGGEKPAYVHLLYGADELAAVADGTRSPVVNWLTATTYMNLFVQAGFEIVDATRRMNSDSPHLRERVAEAYPGVAATELDVAEVDARLRRPVAAEDLAGLGNVIGGHVGHD